MRTELVTTLKRKATELLSELDRDREPILITQHGTPSAYLVDVDSYEKLQAKIKLLEGVARGERVPAPERIEPAAQPQLPPRQRRQGPTPS